MAAKEREVYRIDIDGNWDLEDLYKFPRAYEQVYYAIFSLSTFHDDYTRERINRAYLTYPWQGGYSAVNFYNHLKYTLPKRERPTINSLQKASPGWIELLLGAASTAYAIKLIVNNVCGSIDRINATYNSIYRGMIDRKLARIEAEREEAAAHDHRRFLREANAEMADALLITKEQLDEINNKTRSELKTLKILLSIYRRVRVLAEYQIKGKARP